jgi:hypothetical protein
MGGDRTLRNLRIMVFIPFHPAVDVKIDRMGHSVRHPVVSDFHLVRGVGVEYKLHLAAD